MVTESEGDLAQEGVADTLDADEHGAPWRRPGPVVGPYDATRSPDELGPEPVRPEVAAVARRARDPRIKGLVFSRLFDDEPAERIGRFTVLEQLGAGGMGVVYAAYDDQLDRKVAVKVLRPWSSGPRDRARERLQQEARAMARLSHPNIITVHEVGSRDDEVYVAMEHVRGQSLDRWLEGLGGGQARPWREVVEVFQAAGRGLAAAHREGIVHRDFKPHNVMLSDSGAVKVLDFGLARMVGPSTSRRADEVEADGSPSLTRTGALTGTPAYMSPEQYEGRPADELSDQFGFFASLYHALYRQVPFSSESLSGLARAIGEGRVRPPPSDSSVPRWLHRAVLVGLRVEPSERYPSMQAAVAAIARDPVARRRRWLALAGLVGAVASASIAATSMLGATPEHGVPCDQGHQAMAEAWGESARQGLERGLIASGLSFAEATAQRVLPRLDTYAQRWAAQRDEACVAHRDGAQSATLYDRRLACLEHRRVAFESLVELLQQPDRVAVERALPAAAALPALARCGDVDALLQALPPPEDPAVAARVRDQRRRLTRVEELEALGRYEAGLELVREVAREAEALGHRPLQAEARVREGSLAMASGDPQQAERRLTEGLTHAMACGHTEAVAEALAKRIYVRAEQMLEPERAADDVALGAGLMEQLHAAPRLRGLHLNNVGAYHIRREEPEAATEVLERALRVKREGLDPDDPELAYTMGNLSIALEQQGRDREAIDHIEGALALVERALGPEHPTTTTFMQVKGELLFRTGHPKAARQTLEPLAAGPGSHSPQRRGLLRMLGEIALVERRYEDALAWFERAVDASPPTQQGATAHQPLERTGQARALLGLGQMERGWSMFREALEQLERMESPYLSSHRQLLGRALLSYDQPEAALPQLEQAVALERAQGRARSSVVALSTMLMGRAHRQLGHLDQAQHATDEAAALIQEAGTVSERAEVYAEQALVALAGGQRGRAVERAHDALAALEPWGQPDHVERAQALAVLAEALRSGSPTADDRREAEVLAMRARTVFVSHGGGFSSEVEKIDEILASP